MLLVEHLPSDKQVVWNHLARAVDRYMLALVHFNLCSRYSAQDWSLQHFYESEYIFL